MEDSWSPPTKNLDLFEKLDLEDVAERRAATRVIIDYYGYVLSEAGEAHLGFTPDESEMGVGPQWNKASNRLSSVQNIDVPEEYDSLLNRLHRLQNNVDHNFKHNPEKAVLKEAYNSAQEWCRWLTHSVETYEEAIGQQSAKETMLYLIDNKLNSVISDPEEIEFESMREKQDEINNEAEFIREQLGYIDRDSDSISTPLVNIMADAFQLESEYEGFRDQYQKHRLRGFGPEEEADMKNTSPYYVTEPYDEFTGNITMVSDIVGQEDQTIVVDAHKPDIPESTREKLKEAEPNIRYQVTFGYNANKERYVKDIQQ